jgi:hypothetical protein
VRDNTRQTTKVSQPKKKSSHHSIFNYIQMIKVNSEALVPIDHRVPLKDRAKILCLQSPKSEGDHGDVPHLDEQAEGFSPLKHLFLKGVVNYSNYVPAEESKFFPKQASVGQSVESDTSPERYKNCYLENLDQTVYNGIPNLHQKGAIRNEYNNEYSSYRRTNLNSGNCTGNLF